jgi:glycosyltransferase involved in cell wall biosynthesis
MSSPRVSIGLPVYQGERYIDQAIRSILGQRLDDLELIIADNASTDGTEEICRQHVAEDPRVRYDRAPENRGAAWNFSRLVGMAEAPYFKWASHDDVLHPDFLSRCVAALDDDPAAVTSHTGAVTIDPDGNEVRRWPPNANATRGGPIKRYADILFREGSCFPVFGLHRRDVLLRTGLLGPFNGHDLPLLAELALHGRFVFVPDPLFFNREHPDDSFRDRIAWFDPTMGGRVVYGHPRLLLEYHRAIRRVHLPSRQAAAAHLVTLAWCGRRSPSMARDILGGWRAHLRRLVARTRVST